MIDRNSFNLSWDLIGNLEDRLQGYFFENGDYDKIDLIDWIDDAIKELNWFREEVRKGR